MLVDKGCPLDTLERFIGYAGVGQKEMNKSQKRSYLFTPPVQPVLCGAADGEPNNPGLHKPSWDVDLLPLALTGLCPWLYTEMKKVTQAFEQYPRFEDCQKVCLYYARGCLKSFEQRISKAVKMLASLPLDHRNDLIAEELPIHQRWRYHPIVMLDYFQSEVFGSICHRVQSSQKGEQNVVAEDLSPRQKNYVQEELGTKLMPKLNVANRLSQSILSGQRIQNEEVILHLNSLHTKLDWLIHNHSPSETEMRITDEESPIIASPPSPKPQLNPTSSSSMCHSTYDRQKTTNGQDRKRAPALPVLHRPFSCSNISARNFWFEYKYGLNGGPSLESQELIGSKWRSDTVF
jgi:hypothetical protein